MKRIGRFFKNLVTRKNRKTTAAGIATLIGIGFAAASNPAILADVTTITAVLSGAGLIAAADGNNDDKE